MLAFLDESGDPGMKLEHGSSPLFVVGLVLFESRDEAQRCDDRIAVLRRELSLRVDYEFHFSHNAPSVRTAFLQAVSEFDFRFHVFALDKGRATGPGFQFPESMYKWTAKAVFENAQPYLHEATVILDGRGERRFRKELTTYLRRHINARDRVRPIKKLKTQASRTNNLLQLADYVVGVSAGALYGRATDIALQKRFLHSHQATLRRWPP